MEKGKRELPREKRKISLFYLALLVIVVLILAGIQAVRVNVLQPWLVEFEANQPGHVCQQVFDELFTSQGGAPDWGRLYDLSGQGDGALSRESFVPYMQQHTAGKTLNFVETSAGLSGDRKYIVKAGEERLAVFTLTREGENGWRLGSVELALPQASTVFITAGMDHQVLVNGQALDERSQVLTLTTAAERYLPEGLHGRRQVTWQVEDLSPAQLKVVVLDREGDNIPVLYDPERGYYVELPPQEISPEEEKLAIDAAKVRARFMINAANASSLRQYYDPDSSVYRAITSSDTWMQKYNDYRFSDPLVSSYYRYSESIFSVRVAFTLYVTRTNGTVKEYDLDSTFFFQTKGNSTRVYEMTNMDAQREIVQARLVFMDGESEVGRLLLSSEEHSFLSPAVTAPEGKTFAGWAVRETQGNNITMTIRFQPGEDGAVALPEGYTPEPMVLYAVYADAA